MTEDEMSGWHHRLDGHEFGQTLGVGDGQGGLACCDSWGCKESDRTERLHGTELRKYLVSLEAVCVAKVSYVFLCFGSWDDGRESWYFIFSLREVMIKSLYLHPCPAGVQQPLSSQINETLPGFGKRSFKYTFNLTVSIIHLLKKCSPLELECIIDLKIVVRSSTPVQVRYRLQDAWGWCTGMTQRDDMGREMGGGSGFRTHVHPWQIDVNEWQNQYSINKNKCINPISVFEKKK